MKDIHPGQSVRVQDYVTKQREVNIVKQKVSEPRSYILTSRNGTEHRRNRRHIRTTEETFTCPDTYHSDENTDREHTANRSELATCDNPSKETEPIHVEEPPACVDDASYRTKAGRCVRPPKRLDL